jgi:hypothetical protein
VLPVSPSAVLVAQLLLLLVTGNETKDKEPLTILMLSTISHSNSFARRPLISALAKGASKSKEDANMSWQNEYRLQTKYTVNAVATYSLF